MAANPIYFEKVLGANSNYMAVIKESHESILRRKIADQEKKRILNMDFNKDGAKKDYLRM